MNGNPSLAGALLNPVPILQVGQPLGMIVGQWGNPWNQTRRTVILHKGENRAIIICLPQIRGARRSGIGSHVIEQSVTIPSVQIHGDGRPNGKIGWSEMRWGFFG